MAVLELVRLTLLLGLAKCRMRTSRGDAITPATSDFPTTEKLKECRNLNTLLYSMENGAVDPVFYAVVPDSFMSRTSGGAVGERPASDIFTLRHEADASLLAPSDPWSF